MLSGKQGLHSYGFYARDWELEFLCAQDCCSSYNKLHQIRHFKQEHQRSVKWVPLWAWPGDWAWSAWRIFTYETRSDNKLTHVPPEHSSAQRTIPKEPVGTGVTWHCWYGLLSPSLVPEGVLSRAETLGFLQVPAAPLLHLLHPQVLPLVTDQEKLAPPRNVTSNVTHTVSKEAARRYLEESPFLGTLFLGHEAGLAFRRPDPGAGGSGGARGGRGAAAATAGSPGWAPGGGAASPLSSSRKAANPAGLGFLEAESQSGRTARTADTFCRGGRASELKDLGKGHQSFIQD